MAVLVAVVVVVLAAVVVLVAVLVGHLFLYIKDQRQRCLASSICKLKDYLVKFSHSCMGESVGGGRTGVTVQLRMLLGWVDWETGK